MQTQTEEGRAACLAWMLYFNRTLRERGIITEKEYGRMKRKIQERYGPPEHNGE